VNAEKSPNNCCLLIKAARGASHSNSHGGNLEEAWDFCKLHLSRSTLPMAPTRSLTPCILVCVVLACVGVNAVDVATTTPSAGGARPFAVCNLFCIQGTRCVINKCNRPQCVPLCDGVKCKSGEVCRVTDNTATCVTNPCFLAKCGSSAPNCVVEQGSAKCKACPVHKRYQPVCCKLLDGSLKTTDEFDCGCRTSGTVLFAGECPKRCECPPLELSKADVCCRLPGGSQLSIPACECACRLAAIKGTPEPTPATQAPTASPTKPTPQCKCPQTTSGICCLAPDGNLFYTGAEACCTCLGGKPLGKICPVIDPAPTPLPTSRR
jgi:hypothetical protein